VLLFLPPGTQHRPGGRCPGRAQKKLLNFASWALFAVQIHFCASKWHSTPLAGKLLEIVIFPWVESSNLLLGNVHLFLVFVHALLLFSLYDACEEVRAKPQQS
jgi:hypothetical protein